LRCIIDDFIDPALAGQVASPLDERRKIRRMTVQGITKGS
jgi:hypothetical protein